MKLFNDINKKPLPVTQTSALFLCLSLVSMPIAAGAISSTETNHAMEEEIQYSGSLDELLDELTEDTKSANSSVARSQSAAKNASSNNVNLIKSRFYSDDNLKRFNVSHEVNVETTDILGDRISTRNGSVEFQHTDVALPGNFNIDVAIRRKFEIARATNRAINGAFSNWVLLVPKITTKIVEVEGLDQSTFPADFQNSWYKGKECTEALNLGDVPLYPNDWAPHQTHMPQYRYNTGVFLELEDGSSQPLLSNSAVIATGDYPYITKNNWRISCINISGGEGFKATSPAGVTYTFDKRIDKKFSYGSGVKVPDFQTFRSVRLMRRIYTASIVATKVEDRFGNVVHYHYVGDELKSITASDGRSITLNYQSRVADSDGTESYEDDRVIDTITTHKGTSAERTWTYHYEFNDYNDSNWNLCSGGHFCRHNTLSSVELPHATNETGKRWNFNLNELQVVPFTRGAEVVTITGDLTHPDGTKGLFTLNPGYNFDNAKYAKNYSLL